MYHKYSDGIIEVVTGPMFSGKSEELIKRIKTLSYAGIKTLIIKPKIDTRFSENKIISRNGTFTNTYIASNVQEIKKLFQENSYKALVIDEVQFFQKDLIPFLEEVTNKGVRVIVSGLDQNYLRKPFGIMPELLAIAENVTKLKAVCLVCKNAASCSFRKTESNKEFQLGDVEEYEARCRQCHIEGMKGR